MQFIILCGTPKSHVSHLCKRFWILIFEKILLTEQALIILTDAQTIYLHFDCYVYKNEKYFEVWCQTGIFDTIYIHWILPYVSAFEVVFLWLDEYKQAEIPESKSHLFLKTWIWTLNCHYVFGQCNLDPWHSDLNIDRVHLLHYVYLWRILSLILIVNFLSVQTYVGIQV